MSGAKLRLTRPAEPEAPAPLVESSNEGTGHVQTAAYREYLQALAYAQRLSGRGNFSLLHGRSGTGKTYGAKRFCQQAAGTFYVVCPPLTWLRSGHGYTRTRELWERLAQACGASTSQRGAPALCEAIRRQAEAEGPLLFVLDKAQGICHPSIVDELCFLSDEGEGAVKLALVGTPALPGFFTEHEELATRCPWQYEVRLLTQQEVAEALPGFPAATVEALCKVTGGRISNLLDCLNAIDSGEVVVKGRSVTRQTCTPQMVPKIADAMLIAA